MKRSMSSFSRSEEQKRNLRVDLKRIPEWQSAQEDIRAELRKIDLTGVASAAELIYEMNGHSRFVRSYERTQVRQQLDAWISNLSLESLLHFEFDSKRPSCLDSGDSIARCILDEATSARKNTQEHESKGVTNSLLVAIFSGRTHASTMESLRLHAEDMGNKATSKIPKLESAAQMFDKISNRSNAYFKLEQRLALAFEKKEAIERFEAKHGNAFAKAASIDKKTRNRAASLKRLVDKTPDCPYCSKALGDQPHLDHIYPIASGGLSIKDNLIWCCAACNSKKSDKGLVEFLIEANLPVEAVLTQLRDLRKRI